MPRYRLGQAARILGVSTDTVRRYADAGNLATVRSAGGQRLVDGRDLAKFANRQAAEQARRKESSARNQLLGIVTKVTKDKVAAQVEVRCGAFRVVSLLTRESVDALGLVPGVLVNAVVKATNVVIELTDDHGKDED